MEDEPTIGASADNSLILLYNNDLMDCVYIDLGNQYAVISPHVYEEYDELADKLESVGASVLSVGDFDMRKPPHCYVIESLGKMIVASAEELLD